jgi:hypothetical protein
MSPTRSATVARFLRVAKLRLEDAQHLLRFNRTTGAVYLAGYGAECALKALVFGSIPVRKEQELLRKFRGVRGHNLSWIRKEYARLSGATLPGFLASSFSRVDSWSSELRYESAVYKMKEAEAFLRSVQEILRWAEGRLL